MDLIQKIRDANLLGRSGSRFPVFEKWVRLSEKDGKKFLICNGAEGEPGVFKDKYILNNEPEKVVDGIEKVIEVLDINKSFFYLRKDYLKLFEKKLKNLFTAEIAIKRKDDRYVAGEETSVINSIEGNRGEPKIKPPYPTEQGLWNHPTLIHNVETFYAISEIANDEYKGKKFYCISGAVKNEDVFKLDKDLTVRDVLIKTENYPKFDFLVQVGGGLGGIFLSSQEIDVTCNRLASVKVFDKKKFDEKEKMKSITRLLMHGNCDKCTPCREGIYRINEMLNSGYYDRDLLEEIILALEKSSYCPLGKVAGEVLNSLMKLYDN